MSIKIMTRVWEKSKQGGSQLLLLLAIADNANDDGYAWPGQKYLAKKIRMSKTSIPRLTKKLQEAGELLAVDRSRQGKSIQYVVLVGMVHSQITSALKKYFQYNDEEVLEVLLKTGGVTKLEAPQDGGVTTAMVGGVTTAMVTEPSITVNESPNMPDGKKGSLKTTDTETTTRKELTDHQKQELLIFGKHPDSPPLNGSFDTIQEMQNSGWQIRDYIIEQGIAYYLEAVREYHPNFAIPNNSGIRKDWYKEVEGHLQDHRIDDLKGLYQEAIKTHHEKRWRYSRPGSLTGTLANVAMETQTGDVVAWL